MSIAFTLFVGLCIVAFTGWVAGTFLKRLKGGWNATVGASLLILPGILLFLDAPMHLLGIHGEEIYGFTMFAALTFGIGIIAMTIALFIHSKVHAFGIMKEED